MEKIDLKNSYRLNITTNYLKIYSQANRIFRETENTIKVLYNSLKGKDVYIFGTGPSLLEIKNKEFFKDKAVICINYSYEHMPYYKYVMLGEVETYMSVRKKVPLNKLILPLGMNYNGKSDRDIIWNNESLYYLIEDPLLKLEARQFILDKEIPLFCYTTTTHSAIHLGAYMGAKKIYLVGIDYKKYPDGNVHFSSKDGGSLYSDQNWQVFDKHKEGNEWLAVQLKKFDIELLNYIEV